MAAKKGHFVTPEEIDEFLDDIASDFEVSDTSDKSEDEGKCLVLFTEIFRGCFTFLKDFYFFSVKVYLTLILFYLILHFFVLHLDFLEVVTMVVMVFCFFLYLNSMYNIVLL